MTDRYAQRTSAAIAGLLLVALVAGCTDTFRGGPDVTTPDLGEFPLARNAAGASAGDTAVVWGGETGPPADPEASADGWIVPLSDLDSAEPVPPSHLAARSHHLAVSYGDEVVIWGGLDEGHEPLDDGAVFDPKSNSWRPMAPAPIPLESARAAVEEDQLLIAGGRNQGRPNSSLLVYDFSDDRWEHVDLGVDDVVDWTTVDDGLVTVSRAENGRDLSLAWFDREGHEVTERTLVQTSLGMADYIAVTSTSAGVLVAASDRDRTWVVEVEERGQVTRETEMDAASFVPARRVEEPFAGSMARQDGLWISAGDRRITALSVEELEAVEPWELDACQTAATWVSAGEGALIRYGGLACGGDTADPRHALSLVEFEG